MIDLWLCRNPIELSFSIQILSHLHLFFVLLQHSFFILLLMFEIELVLPSVFPIHGSLLQLILLLYKVYIVLQLCSGGYCNLLHVSSQTTHCLLHTNFALVNVKILRGIIAWLTTTPEPPNDVLSMLHKQIGEYLVEVVLFQGKVHLLRRVHFRDYKLYIGKMFVLLQSNLEFASLFKWLQGVTPLLI